MSNYVLYSDGCLVSTDELYHYGVKGMKWGVRRYQNKDGSPTSAGEKRIKKAEKLIKSKKFNNLVKKAEKLANNSASRMSKKMTIGRHYVDDRSHMNLLTALQGAQTHQQMVNQFMLQQHIQMHQQMINGF